MASNQFGNIFKMTTWGESHGSAIGVVIDGCPAGIAISADEINFELEKRAPGKNPFVTPRKEKDKAEILSGVFEGYTTGAPISVLIKNMDVKSDSYHAIKELYKPGHANFTYLKKYGIFDYKGSGRASARETAARVIAGAIAKKLLASYGIETCAYLKRIEKISFEKTDESIDLLKKNKEASVIFCPSGETTDKMIVFLEKIKEEGDSIGGIVEFVTSNLPVGLGDPVYEKLEANLAKAMLSIPASKGFEIGEGFNSVNLKGSESNDCLTIEAGDVHFTSNSAGGTLGGISNGMPITGRVVFKATSSIFKKQQTVDIYNQKKHFKQSKAARHDPCVAVRAVAVVEAMLNIVIADAVLMNKNARHDPVHK